MTSDLHIRQDRYRGWLMGLVFAITACLGYVGPLGIAALAAVAGLGAMPLARVDGRARLGAGLLAALVVYAMVSMAWSRAAPNLAIQSYDDLESLTGVKLGLQALLYAALVAAAAGLQAAPAERALRVFAFAMTGLAALLILDGVFEAQIYQAMLRMIGQPIRPDLALRNVGLGGYVLAVMVWPVSMLLRREGHNLLVIALVAGVVGAMVLFGADAPAAALAVGLAALAAVVVYGRPAVATLGAVSVFYILAAPWLVTAAIRSGLMDGFKASLPASWDARLDIWTFAAAGVAERPLLGWGLDASRTWPGVIPLHPHNGALQLWLELGAPGAVLAAGFVAWLYWSVAQAREGRGFMGVAAATLAAYLTIGALSFGVWQEWWLGVGAIAFCACLALKRAIPLWSGQRDLPKTA